MSEFLSRLADAAEKEDIEKIEGLTKGYLIGIFEKSLRKQLTESGYFPDLSPMYSEKYDELDESETNKLQKKAEEKVQSEDFLLLLETCDLEAIKDIASYDYLSLFEVALLFGYRVSNDPRSNIYQYVDLFIDASLSGKITPREPSSKIPFRNIPKSPVAINGEIFLTRPSIDLSWELTRKEVYDFAMAIGYQEKLFADLLGKTDDQTAELKNADIQTSSVENQSNKHDENEQSLWKSKNERDYLLRTIGALSLLLIEKTQGNQFGHRDKPNKSGIYKAIEQILYDMGFSKEGQGKTILNDVLKEALDTAMKK